MQRGDRVAELHERADRGGRGVEHGDAVALAELPETAAVGEGGRTFVHDERRARGERTVGDIAVAGDPADIGRAPEDIVVAQVEHPAGGDFRAEQVARARMLDAFRATRGTRGVEQEQRMLGVDPLRLAGGRLVGDGVVPPDIAAGDHRGRRARRGALDPRPVDPPQHEHGLDRRAAVRQRLVGGGLELHDLSAAPTAVGGDHAACAGVLDAVLQR